MFNSLIYPSLNSMLLKTLCWNIRKLNFFFFFSFFFSRLRGVADAAQHPRGQQTASAGEGGGERGNACVARTPMSARTLGCVRADTPCPCGRVVVSARTQLSAQMGLCPHGHVRTDASPSARSHACPHGRVRADALMSART
jgi:hypothetical protein